MTFSWKIGGEAGFGIMTTGLLFSKIASRLGYYILDYVEYPSLIRGGHNAYEVCVSDGEVTALKKEIDVLVCLNEETFHKHRNRLNSQSLVLYDKEEFDFTDNFNKVNVRLKKILTNLKGQAVMKNTIALGASLSILGGKIEVLLDLIAEQFKKKGDEIVRFNQNFAIAGYEEVKKNYSFLIKNFLIEKEEKKEKLVVSGNEAFSLGAVFADCRLYAAYPMTPSSSVLHTLASWQEKTGMIVRHSEDEIAVINTALGASFAGVRAAVGTSGGGFSLMVESLSFAGVAEIPVVVLLAQRPGPATGMPTWTEQGDLLFAVFSGHGEFPKIVLSPGDQKEMIELTLKAFNLADIYQTLVIVVSDMYLSEGHKSVERDWVDKIVREYQIRRGKINLSQKENPQKLEIFLRYKITEDGISEKILPGTTGYFYQENSYEHLEDGHTTEEAKPRKDQVEKRLRKWQTYLKNDFQLPKFYGNEKAEIVFISWGSTKGIVLEAQKRLKEKGIETGFYHFNHIYPLDKEKVSQLLKKDNERYLLVENNALGQFGKILAMETELDFEEKILRYDGRPITVEQILEKI